MKFHIEVDCTPEEGRAFLGLPDVKPLQESMMAEAEARLKSAVASMDPEALMKTWLGGGESVERMQKAFWSAMSGSPSGGSRE